MQRVRSKEQAKKIAADECEARNWPFRGPVNVIWRPFTYVVWTNAMSRGGNAHIVVRKRDGAILEATITPR